MIKGVLHNTAAQTVICGGGIILNIWKPLHFTNREYMSPKTNLTPPLLIKESEPSQEMSGHVYACVC